MKPLLIMGGVLLAVLPWFSGGRDPIAVLISVFGLTISLFLLLRHASSPRVASFPLRVLTTLWLGWAGLSLVWTVNRFETEMWILYALIAVVTFAVSARLSLPQKLQLLEGYAWVATFAALYGLYLYLTGDYARLTSSFYWANPCAAYLLPATFWAGWRWVSDSKRSWIGVVHGLQLAILGASVWLTDSRAALLVAAAVLAMTLSSRAVRQRWVLIAGIIGTTFVLSLGVAALRSHIVHQSVTAPGSRFAEAARGESTSVEDRVNYLKSSAQIWQKHPIHGTGPGTFGTVHPQFQQRVISASNDPHNYFAQTLSEQGIIGFIILIYLFVMLSIGMVRGVAREPVLAAAAAGAGVLLLHFGLDIDGRYPALIALLAMLIGVCYQPWHHWQLRSSQRASLLAVLILALILSIGAYRSSVAFSNGQIYDDNHQLAQAAESYAAAHESPVFNPNVYTAEGIDYFTLANLTGGSKRYLPAAKSSAHKAIAADPNSSQAYQLLGRVEELDGRHTAATNAFKTAIRLDRWNHPEYYVDIAALYLRQGKVQSAQSLIAQGLELYPDEVVQNRSADATIKPAVAELLALRAAERLSQGATASAQRDITRALRLDPHNRDAIRLKTTGLN